jgi:hypothetical protein
MALKVDILNPKNDIFAVGGAAAIAEHMRSRGGRTFAREFEWWKGRLKAQTRVILEFPSVQAFKIGRRRPNTKNSNQSASRPAKTNRAITSACTELR